ncbi:MAG: hypothetical protein L6Q76_38535 [Polyangiaceae bacterium]|nr:hypothetical protein [Polyangiaceae bacterium]
MVASEKPREIEAATKRARRGLYGLLVAAVFFGFYGGVGLGERIGRGFPTGWAVVAIGLAIVAVGAPGLIRKLEAGEAEALKRARAARSAGSIGEAAKLLGEIVVSASFQWVKREALLELARLSLSSGTFEEAEYCVNLVLAEPEGLYGSKRSHELVTYEAELRKAPGKQRGSAFGRAALAEAIGLERRGDREGLKELLDREESRLEKLKRPRERALVAALRQRAREADGASVYRQRTASSGGVAADPALDAWVEKILKPAEECEPTLKIRVAEPRVRVAEEPPDHEADAELEAVKEALEAAAPRRARSRDA